MLRLFSWYGTGKTIYTRVLKPIYEELRKDAYELKTPEKETIKKTRKTSKKNVVNKKPKRSHKRQANTEQPEPGNKAGLGTRHYGP